MSQQDYIAAIRAHLVTSIDGLDAMAKLPAIAPASPAAFNPDPLFAAIRQQFGSMKQSQVDALNAAIALATGQGKAFAAPVGDRLTLADFQSAAKRLACTVAQIRAVDEVESGGGWFTDMRADILDLDGPGGFIDGTFMPKILFEARPFSKATGGKYDASHPNISSPTWNRALYVGGQGEYQRLYAAMQLDRAAALESTSWGRYQIMGFNHELAGYPDVEEFVEAMKHSESLQLNAFCDFIIHSNMAAKLRKISDNPVDCRPFAGAYNGEGFEANHYDDKIAGAHKKFRLLGA